MLGMRVTSSIARRAVEHRLDVDALERGGQQADGAELAGATADPVPHREAGEPPSFFACLIELRLPAPVTATACFAERRGPRRLYAAIASSMPLRVSAVPPDFEMTTDERLRELVAATRRGRGRCRRDRCCRRTKTRQLVLARIAERVGDELRTERRAADADRRAGA